MNDKLDKWKHLFIPEEEHFKAVGRRRIERIKRGDHTYICPACGGKVVCPSCEELLIKQTEGR